MKNVWISKKLTREGQLYRMIVFTYINGAGIVRLRHQSSGTTT